MMIRTFMTLVACAAIAQTATAGPDGECELERATLEAETKSRTLEERIAAYREETRESVRNARERKLPAKAIADRYVKGAGQCRDAGAPPACAIEYFEAAIRNDPSHARAHMLYGDFLSFGYLGRYTQAAHHYAIARKLLEGRSDPEANQLRSRLERSWALLHRDAGDGVPVLVTSAVSVFATPNGERNRELRPWARFGTDFHSTTDLLIQEIRLMDLFVDANGNPLLDINALRRRVPLTKDTTELNTGMLVRFGNPWIPFVKYWFQWNDIDPFSADGSDLAHPFDAQINQHALAIGKTIPVSPNIDVYTELAGALRSTKLHESFSDPRIRIETEDTQQLELLSAMSLNLGLSQLQLRAQAMIAGHDNSGSDEDFTNRQTVEARFSIRPEREEDTTSYWPVRPSDLVSDRLFLGRRSTQFALGGTRIDRSFHGMDVPTVNITEYSPFASTELLGLVGGELDVLLHYQYRRTKIDRGPGGTRSFNTHWLTLTPTWVPVFNLYDQSFRTGFEELRVAFPLQAELGGGRYDRVRAGLELNQRYVLPHIGVRVSVMATYGHFYQLDEDVASVFVRVGLESGSVAKF